MVTKTMRKKGTTSGCSSKSIKTPLIAGYSSVYIRGLKPFPPKQKTEQVTPSVCSCVFIWCVQEKTTHQKGQQPPNQNKARRLPKSGQVAQSFLLVCSSICFVLGKSVQRPENTTQTMPAVLTWGHSLDFLMLCPFGSLEVFRTCKKGRSNKPTNTRLCQVS